MAITHVIPGTTLIDQLSSPTVDGYPDENANDNCVAASIAEALHILTGKTYEPDQIKDIVYGQGFTGVQSAARYVDYCASQGVSLASYSASQAGLIATIHAQVDAGHPVIVTMPSQWGTAPSDPVHPAGYTHVGVAVGTGPGMIRVMNPWHGFYQDESDAWWQARLCYGQVWPMLAKGASVATGTAGTATPFFGLVYTGDAQVWHCPTTNCDLGHGFLAFYQGIKGPDGQVATEILGLPKSNEYKVNGLVKQDFERGRLVWNANAQAPWQVTFDAIASDLQTGAQAVVMVAKLTSQLQTAGATIADLQQQLKAAQSADTLTPAQQDAINALAALKTALTAIA